MGCHRDDWQHEALHKAYVRHPEYSKPGLLLILYRYLDIPQIVLIPKLITGPNDSRTNPLLKVLPESLTVFKTCRSPGSPDQHTRRQMDKIVLEYVKKNKNLMERFWLARRQHGGDCRRSFEDDIREDVIHGYTTFW